MQGMAAYLIQKATMNYIQKLKNLPKQKYKDITIEYDSIYLFYDKNSKATNDRTNKVREAVLFCVMNEYIPSIFYRYSLLWKRLYLGLFYVLAKEFELDLTRGNITYLHAGGRGKNHDFEIDGNFVEFKNNALSITDVPQFLSLGNPSIYTDMSYEEFYYDSYLLKLLREFDMEIPDKEIYIKEVKKNTSPKLEYIETKYKKDNAFAEKCKKYDDESRIRFIQMANLNIEKINEKIMNTQLGKNYLFHKNGKFKIMKFENEDFIITDYCKIKYSYICETKNYNTLELLLRWKNRKGVLFPSFQISYKGKI